MNQEKRLALSLTPRHPSCRRGVVSHHGQRRGGPRLVISPWAAQPPPAPGCWDAGLARPLLAHWRSASSCSRAVRDSGTT